MQIFGAFDELLVVNSIGEAVISSVLDPDMLRVLVNFKGAQEPVHFFHGLEAELLSERDVTFS